ncbi:hypothetical protein LQ327_14100 [Actinomycetospora endophytica]|uniref:Uncharacterized protein n=1 Tax=Actinomycetospora endophytica TaxID=2291215 RepID=A0ABS8P894_9PSEU|nr:hypothetical protein [Actinomycetospora endophytica]MCD2194502.1 hypothetical protein [Actinomycetospora endophytica]
MTLLGTDTRAFGLNGFADDEPVPGSSASVGRIADDPGIEPDEPVPPVGEDEPSESELLPGSEVPEPDGLCEVPDEPPVTPPRSPPTGSLGWELPPLPSSVATDART